jgi:4-hydroxy-tetrahydrodipicolinate synthase
MKKLYGTGVALITPFTSTGDIDFDALARLLKHTAKGVDYYVLMGTTGESATVTHEEKLAVLDFVKQNNPKKLPIVYGIGGNNTAEVINQINNTNLKGVSALLSVSPYYNKPSQDGLVEHFLYVAAVSPVPVILYNVPGRTGSNLTAETTLRLAEIPNIIGIKEASGNLEQCMRIIRKAPKDFMLIAGDDLLTAPILSLGGVGVISVLANAYPEIFKAITIAATRLDFKKAAQETFRLLDINGLMYEEGNPSGIKYLLQLMKICGQTTRLPMMPPSHALQERIKKSYKLV